MAEAPPPSVKYFESPRYGSMYRQSVADPGKFWGGLARSMLTWIKDFEQVMDCDMEAGKIRWFLGGKLNVSGAFARCVLAPGPFQTFVY